MDNDLLALGRASRNCPLLRTPFPRWFRAPVARSPGLDLYYEDGTKGATITLTPQREALVALFGDEGRSRISLLRSQDGDLGLFLGREGGQPSILLTLAADGTSQVAVRDNQGQVLWEAPLSVYS